MRKALLPILEATLFLGMLLTCEFASDSEKGNSIFSLSLGRPRERIAQVALPLSPANGLKQTAFLSVNTLASL